MELAFYSSGAGYWDWNIDTGEMHFSDRMLEILGYGPNELEGHFLLWQKFIYPDDFSKVMKELDEHLNSHAETLTILKESLNIAKKASGNGGINEQMKFLDISKIYIDRLSRITNNLFVTEYRVLTKDGEWKWVLCKGKVVEFDKDGKPLRMTGIHSDITEHKHLDQKKKEFISTVSHEIKAPLAILKESLNIATEASENGNVNKHMKFLDISKRNIDRLARFTNNLLDYQKLSEGKVRFNKCEDDINELIKEIIRDMIPLAIRKELEFKTNLTRDIPKIKFDKDRIAQVLVNLISNAIKFTKKGDITVTTRRNDNKIKVSVKDTGIGIEINKIESLFELYVQLYNKGERKKDGSGLGLAISKEIVKRHGGEMQVVSKYGKGSSFSFTLPVVVNI